MTRARTWGGAREGAGRPCAHGRASEPHKVRPMLSPHHAAQVSARIVRAVGDVRRGRRYAAVRRAITRSLGRADFRIVHLAIRRASIELVVEANDRVALARGMQGFLIAAAHHLNRSAARDGTVFPDRYRAAILSSAAAVRAALGALGASGRVAQPIAWPVTWIVQTAIGLRPAPRAWWGPAP